jgi:hypothetical protein
MRHADIGDDDERLWRFGGGESAESQEQGRELIAPQEERVRERNAGNRSSSALLDLRVIAQNRMLLILKVKTSGENGV